MKVIVLFDNDAQQEHSHVKIVEFISDEQEIILTSQRDNELVLKSVSQLIVKDDD